MERFILFTVNGVAFGAVYASVALALVIVYRSTRVLNFAQEPRRSLRRTWPGPSRT